MKKDYPDASYLCDLAKRSGDVIVANFSLGMEKRWKSDNTPLTVTDTAINAEVCARMLQDYPHIQVLGEEENHEVKDAEYTVICDPVDGTLPFSHGLPVSSFCIALLHNQIPIVSVIYDPFMKRMWHAERNKGSFLGTEKNRVSHKTTLHQAMLYASLLHPKIFIGSLYNPLAVINGLFKKKALIIDVFSLAYFGGLVACGEFDATIHPLTQGWETAAMQIIVEEAGGKATDIYGNDLRYNSRGEIQGHIISNGRIHDELVALINQCLTTAK